MAKSLKKAVMYPREKGRCQPITINWSGESVVKATDFMKKACSHALKEQPPRVFKQIVYFYREQELIYIKPFN